MGIINLRKKINKFSEDLLSIHDQIEQYKGLITKTVNQYDSNHHLLGSFYNILAGLYYQEHNYSQAKKYFELSIENTENNEIEDDVLALRYYNYGSLLLDLNQVTDGEKLIRKSLKVANSASLLHHTIKYDLAMLLFQNGEYLEPDILFNELIQYYRDYDLTTDLLNTLNSYASFLVTNGKFSRSKVVFKETLNLIKHHWGKDHFSFAIVLFNLVSLYQQTGVSKTVGLLKKSLLILKSSNEDVDNYIINTNEALGNYYYNKFEFKEALPYYEKAEDISIKIFGLNHKNSLNLAMKVQETLRLLTQKFI